jgi:bifunctional non-homologous end joining protein LigD
MGSLGIGRLAEGGRSGGTMSRDTRPASFRVTHADRVVDRASGATKLDVVKYYFEVARPMVPHLRGRPVSLVRAPEGIAGQTFFQKHATGSSAPGATPLPADLDPARSPLLTIGDAAGLVAAAQANAIEFHTWNAKARTLERPDRVVFDLDPGEGVGFDRVREAALLVRALVEELGLRAYLKTTGGRGLHVVVPITTGASWDESRHFARAVAVHLQRTFPDRFSATSGERNRIGRVFVDWMRNARGATTVAAWSLRARPGLGVSVPVAWEELDRLDSGSHWTLDTIGPRLDRGDAWQRFAGSRRSLRAAAEALATVL